MLARGDATAGAILLILVERGVTRRVVERGLNPDGSHGWLVAGPAAIEDADTLSEYIARRRRNDPDLWVVELDGPASVLADLG